MRSGADMVVVDSRPFDEFQRVSIPSATNVPGAELVLRIHDIAPSPDTLVVVNCAGRTRSIIGAQSLINAGLPNKVVALRNGTMGWTLAGLMPDSGKTRRFTEPSSGGLAWAKSAAERRRQAVRRHAHRCQGAGELPRRHDANALCVRRARPDRLRRRPFSRRGQRAGRPARPGHRSICRHARRADRADRRPRGPRGDDGVVAQADGLARCVRAGRKRQRERPAAGAGARRRAARGARHRGQGIVRAGGEGPRHRDRSLAQPGLSQGPHPRRLVRHPHAAVARAGEDPDERRTGPHLGGRRARRPRGGRNPRAVAAICAAATPPGRRPGSRSRPKPAWPTSRWTTGRSPTSAPATPRPP